MIELSALDGWGLALPVLYTLFAWWFSTGVILYLVGLPRWTHPWTFTAFTLLLGIALLGVAQTLDDTRVTGAYLSFTAALAVWAWVEVAFLLGYVTGPRREPCPAGVLGWRRVWLAVQSIAYHELALLALGAAIIALSLGAANTLALWTFGILWVMRLSAKLNVFLGVRNLNIQFLPRHLSYLGSYFRQRPLNKLFPVVVLAATLGTVSAWQAALAPEATPFSATAHVFAAMLLTLAVLEHWFMVIPLPFEALWKWGMKSRERVESV